MTFRARPAATRSHTLDERSRRSLLLNVGFGLTIVAALALLAIAFGATWYNQHFAAAATVNGQSISKDALAKQKAVDAFRVGYQERRIRTLLTAGRIRTVDAEGRQSLLDQRRQQADAIALEELIDGRVMDQLASQEGVPVTDADVDARFTEEATTSELRHAWLIAVEPKLATGESAPTDAEKATAKQAADKALADLKAGKSWEEVAKAVSTDTTKAQGGDLGYVDNLTSFDQTFVDALFAAQPNQPTAVVEGADLVYRIGRVTDVVAPQVDATLADQVTGEGIALADFRGALRQETLRRKLNDAIVARVTAPGPQRHVEEIYLKFSESENGEGAIRVRHILYSPKKDPQNASTVPLSDPSWKDAEDRATAAYNRIAANPDLFDSIARAESDEGAQTTGGKLPYFSKTDQIDKAFADAVFKPGLKPGQLLQPVRSAFGWHVIQIMHGPTDLDWAKSLKAEAEVGRDFAKLARDNSDDASAAKGGDIGWVAKGQLRKELEDAIFATKVGGVSEPVNIESDGVYLFRVLDEQTRAPDAEQKKTLESQAFSVWYSGKKAEYQITRDESITNPAPTAS